VGKDTIGLDIGPSTLAIVSRNGKTELLTFCEELTPNVKNKRRLQRKMDRSRRATNPDNYDEKGRVKKHGKTRLRWKESKRYQATRRQHANAERRLAAHRKSLHGYLAHRIVQIGPTITIEKTSFKGWQKQYGRSIGFRAPGLFVAHLTRIVAKTGGTPSAHLCFQNQTESVLPEVGAVCEESQIAALASLLMWAGTSPERLVLGLSAGPPGTGANHPLCHPARLGGCGAAPASRDGGSATTCE
jgi:hypothetical protein